MVCDFDGSIIGPEILTVLEIKGQFLHRVRLHVKVPGWIITDKFEVFENDIFDCKVLWVVGKCEWNSVGFFVL